MDDLIRAFSVAERSALRLEGESFELFGVQVLVDEPDVLESRITIARADAPKRLIVDRMSAAWVWRATSAPPQIPELCFDMRARSTKVVGPSARIRNVHLSDSDIVRTRAGNVLSPWRTLLHLLRWPPDHEGADGRATCMALAERCSLDSAGVRTRIEASVGANQVSRMLTSARRLLD